MMMMMIPSNHHDNNSTTTKQQQQQQHLLNSTTTTPLTVLTNNISYFYLQNELGLSEEAMWRVTFDASSVLGMTADTVRHKVHVLQEQLQLTDANDLRYLLERQPTLLHLSADNNIQPKLQLLRELLWLEQNETTIQTTQQNPHNTTTTTVLRELVLAAPSILTYSTTTLTGKVRFWTRSVGMTPSQVAALWIQEPKLLTVSVSNGLEPRLRFWTKELDFTKAELRVMVHANPRIFLYSLHHNLIPKLVFFLILTLRMNSSQVRRLLMSYPDFLNYNLERHIVPMTRYFTNDLSYSVDELQSILLKFPRLVTHSLAKIKYCVGFFRYQLSMTADQVKRVLYQAPQVIGLQPATVSQKIGHLQETLGLTPDQVVTVVVGMPTLLNLSVDRNVAPKLEFLLQALGGAHARRKAVLRLPTLLGYSLEKRIQPRMEAILDAGLEPSCITVGIPMKQEKFEAWLERRVEKKRKMERADDDTSVVPFHTNLEGFEDRIAHWTRERRGPPTL